jgi:hypothetical protein
MTVLKGLRDHNADNALYVVDMSDTISKIHPDLTKFITLLMKMRKESGANMEFKHLEDDWAPNSTSSTADLTNETTINVTTGTGKQYAADDLMINPTTGEVMLVTAVATDALTVTRGYGSVAVADILTTDVLYRFANSAIEGGSIREAVATAATPVSNYCQDFQHTTKLTDIDAATKAYIKNPRAYGQAMAMQRHKLELNASFWFGQKKLDTTTSKVRHMTGGMIEWLASSPTKDLGGQPITDKALFDWIGGISDYSTGSNVWAFCSKSFLTQIALLQLKLVRLKQSEEKYGVRTRVLETPHMDVNLVEEKAFSYHGYTNYAVLVDMNNVSLRVFSGDGLNGNTKLTVNRQNPGDHYYADEVRSIMGPRVRVANSHSIFKNFGA